MKPGKMQPAGIEPTLQESESCVLSVRLRLLNWLIDSTENIITHNLKKIKTFLLNLKYSMTIS